jgi:hypothetical protein
MFEQIVKGSKGKQIVMFLDYDGTLSPIVEDPDRAFMTNEVSVAFIYVLYNPLVLWKFFIFYTVTFVFLQNFR